MPVLEISVEQLAKTVERFSEEELEKLESLLLKKELDKRSKEVKKEGYLRLDELSSLQDV